MIDRAGLEIRYTLLGYRGFESLTFRNKVIGEWRQATLFFLPYVDAIISRIVRYYCVLRYRFVIILSLMMLFVQSAFAQYDPNFSHYFDMEPSYNPASVGKEAKINVTAAYALNFAGFENNPRTMYFGADIPFYAMKSYHGVGGQFMNDQIGAFKHQRLTVQYANKQRLFGGTLGIGIQAGLLLETFDGSKIDVVDTDDPVFTSGKLDGNAVDLGAGLYYMRGRWYVGASVLHITAPLIQLGERNELQVDRTYYLTGGYNIKLRNPFLTIHPSALLRTDGSNFRADVTARLVYTHEKRFMYAGVSYSPTNSVTAMIGGSLYGVNLGYSYEMYTGGISLGHGSHELVVSYKVDINLVKKGRNLHKSVRIL